MVQWRAVNWSTDISCFHSVKNNRSVCISFGLPQCILLLENQLYSREHNSITIACPLHFRHPSHNCDNIENRETIINIHITEHTFTSNETNYFRREKIQMSNWTFTVSKNLTRLGLLALCDVLVFHLVSFQEDNTWPNRVMSKQVL